MNAAMLRERKGNKQTNKHNRPAKLQDKDIVEIYESYNAWREKATNKQTRQTSEVNRQTPCRNI